MDTGDNGRDTEDWDRDMRDIGTLSLGEGQWRDWDTDPGNRAGM